MVWIAALAACVLPAAGVTVVMRCPYWANSSSQGMPGEHPPSARIAPSAATAHPLFIASRISPSDAPPSMPVENVAVGPMKFAAIGDVVNISLLALEIAHQEQVDVVGLQGLIEWRRQMIFRRSRRYEGRRHD